MVLMLTAAGSAGERVSGLRLGADDYLAKPFHFAELVLRIRALARRQPASRSRTFRAAGVELDPQRRTVTRDGHRLDLSAKEFAVLEALLSARPAFLSTEDLLEQAWDEHADPFTNIVFVTISRRRRKLGDPQVIESQPGAPATTSADGYQSGQYPATANWALSMSIASFQSCSAMPASSRHSGAIRLAPIAKLMCSSWAARASAPAKYPAPARIATQPESPCPRRQGGQAPARGAADPARCRARVIGAVAQISGQHRLGLGWEVSHPASPSCGEPVLPHGGPVTSDLACGVAPPVTATPAVEGSSVSYASPRRCSWESSRYVAALRSIAARSARTGHAGPCPARRPPAPPLGPAALRKAPCRRR